MKNKVYIENIKETREYESNILLSDILKDVEARLPYPVYLAKLDNAYRALTHQLTHDCTLEFLDLRNNEAWLVYQNSLVLVFIKAVHDMFGKETFRSSRNMPPRTRLIT